MSELVTDERLRVLEQACDALAPSLEAPSADPVERAFFARGALEMRIPTAVAAGLDGMAPHARDALIALLDELDRDGFADRGLEERTALLHAAAGRVPQGRFAVKLLKAAVFGLYCAWPDQEGRNPNWEAMGYPGPASAPPPPERAPKTIAVERLRGPEAELEADVCVVGSGAGGGVIAGMLAQGGRSVLVLEAGGYRNEADFRQLELPGTQELYLHGGVIWSQDGSLGMIAGATLGGGTVVNSLVCLRPPDDVRARWARAGLEGLDSPEFDRHLDAVWTRLGVNAEATRYNRATELMIRGLDARGMTHERIFRNATLDDDERFCGYCNAGCQQGCKQSTLKTYLQDAADAGARFVVDCHAERVLVERGRAAGVEAIAAGPDGPVRLRVRAPVVVVAGGSIESPALLLRSGIGGPAVGRHLQVHPTYMISGVYDDPVDGWSGQIQSAVSFDLTAVEDGGGFLVETLNLSPALWAGHLPWVDGRAHRGELLKLRFTAPWHGVSHDHGSGRVTLDARGRPLVRWSLSDEIDRRVAARAHVELARLHHAAGAAEVFTFLWRDPHWRRGEDLEGYLDFLRAVPPEDATAFSAHQMSACRMGADPATSVADGRGQLHDTPGVWVGDASALPTSPGVNPMISIMGLAHRTAGHIAAAG